MEKKIFVIILNWERPQLTIDCLKSLKKLDTKGFNLKIVVVDNGSKDDSVQLIRDFDSQLMIIKNKQNLGFAEGNNVGIGRALEEGAEYVLILNNDTLVDKSLIVELLKTAQTKENFGAASPKIYFAKGFEFHKKYKKNQLGRVIWYAGGRIDWDNVYGTPRGVDMVDRGQFNKEEETDFATGTCLFLSTEALKKVGLFDKRYYLYFEDTDLSMRLKKAGFGVFYQPKALLWHKVSQSSAIGSALNDYFITRNRLLFGMKYARWRTKLALIKESFKFLISGRPWQKIGARDFYLLKFGKGSWK